MLTNAARNYMMATRPSWAKYFTVDSRCGCYFWSHKPKYHYDFGIYCRVEGEYLAAKLPPSVSMIEELKSETSGKEEKRPRPALWIVPNS